MLLSIDNFGDVWERLRTCAAASPDAITVLILVAPQVDALATCTMMTRLLEDEEISHNVKPVRDYGMLNDIFAADILENTELRSVLLLNCGGIVDLMSHLQDRLSVLDEGSVEPRSIDAVPHADCCWFVLDSHRPINVPNALYPGNKLCVLHDDPSDDLDEMLEQEHILNDSEFEEEDDEEDGEPPARRQRTTESEYRQLSPDSRASRYHALKQIERRYYSRAWHGTSSAVLMFSLVQALSKTCNEQLWLAVLGLTDQLVHERVPFDKYTEEAQQLQEQVRDINPTHAQDTTTVTGDDGISVSVAQHVSTSMRLESVQELRLCLLRHWSLYEALEHSRYFASRLGLYTSKGRDKLDNWLARMGIPLTECRQSYAYMDKEIRDGLFDRMHQFGSEYGLQQLTYPSFRRVTSYSSTVTAADLVYCIDAQLEGAAGPSTGSADDDAEEATAQAFSTALSTLAHFDDRGTSQRTGIDRAKRLLKALMAQGNRIITQKQFSRMADFYQVILKPGGDSDHFSNVQALIKLALFVADALREGSGQVRQGLPVLMAAPRKDKTHLVVAVQGSARYCSGRTSFGKAFLASAKDQDVHARSALENFEASVCVVASDDLHNFINGVIVNYDGSS